MNFEKLKETARKYEQKEEWRRAIEVYLQAIREFEAGHDPVPDLSVYNRVGDLYLKANEPGAAVQAYERAADLYGEQGFHNNAIALCGKILRVNPGRIQTYLKLAHLHARKNVVIEAKKNLLEYLERMNALSQLDEAFNEVKNFADQFPGNKEIRLMLSELLRASSRNAEAREQLEKLATDLEARGDTVGARKTLMRLQALDADGTPTIALPSAEPAPPGMRPRSGDLVFLDTGAGLAPVPPPAPAGPQSRKTRAMPAPRQTPPKPIAGLPLIVVPDDPAMSRVDDEPLRIETASLVDEPLELEPLPILSDEAQREVDRAGGVSHTLGFEPTLIEQLDAGGVAPLEGLEIDAPAPHEVDLESAAAGLELERTSDAIELESIQGADFDLVPVPIESPGVEGAELPPFQHGRSEAILVEPPDESPALELIQPDDEPEFVVDEAEGEGGAGADTAGAEPSIAMLEDRVLDDPEDPETHRALGEALLAAGETLRGQEELELALAGYESREDWARAADLVDELIRIDPNGVRYHQKRVEVGFRSGDRARLIESYVELADALLRVGALDKALAVYRRVAEHDPGNQRAAAALDALAPPEEEFPPIPPEPSVPRASGGRLSEVAEGADEALDAMFDLPAAPPAPPAPAPKARPSAPVPAGGRASRKSTPAARPPEPEPEGDWIDLGALVMDEEKVKDSRMRVEGEEPTGDEQADFRDMLSAFRRGIDANIDAEDYQAHYDLGVAFKEMGLLDEAIAEFQKALRSPEGRLKTSEALGTAFFEKQQYAIAEAILRRAVESLGSTDDEQIGLLYWLGRAQEAQGKVEPAIQSFERVLAVDISFRDVGARVSKLSAGRGS